MRPDFENLNIYETFCVKGKSIRIGSFFISLQKSLKSRFLVTLKTKNFSFFTSKWWHGIIETLCPILFACFCHSMFVDCPKPVLVRVACCELSSLGDAARLLFIYRCSSTLISNAWIKLYCESSDSCFVRTRSRFTSFLQEKVAKDALFNMMCDFWDTVSTSRPSLVPVLSLRGFWFAFSDFSPLTNREKIIIFSFTCLILRNT